MLFTNKNTNKGQALLLVVLVMSVVVVAGLSFASRSVTDVGVTSLEEDASRAFSAAEAGVEQALLDGTVTAPGSPVTLPNSGSEYEVTINQSAAGSSFKYPEAVSPGQSATFWFVEHDTDGDLTCAGGACTRTPNVEVCYGTPGTSDSTSSTPAIEVSVFYDTSLQSVAPTNNFSNVNVARFTSDPYEGRTPVNNFTKTNSGCSFDDPANDYEFSQTINLNSLCTPPNAGCLLLAKVRVLYGTNSHPVGIFSGNGANQALPPQGRVIESTGTSGDSSRRVQVFQGFPEPPTLFESAVFSLNDLVK